MIAPALVNAVIWQESRGNPKAVNPHSGASGLMQIMPDTAKAPGFGIKPLDWGKRFDPRENARFGVDYLAAMLGRYRGDVRRALAAYNWGPGNADKWDGRLESLPAETRGYIQNIVARVADSGQIMSDATPRRQQTAKPAVDPRVVEGARAEVADPKQQAIEAAKAELARRQAVDAAKAELARRQTQPTLTQQAVGGLETSDGSFAPLQTVVEGLRDGDMDKITSGLMAGGRDFVTRIVGNGLSMMEGSTLGRSGEVISALDPKNAPAIEGMREKYEEQNPISALVSETAGMAIPALAAGASGLTLAGRIPTIAGQIGGGALEGAAYAGLYGSGKAEPGERLEGAMEAAPYGALGGGAIPAAAALGKHVVSPVFKAGANILGIGNADDKAAAMIGKSVTDDAASIQPALPGKPDTLLDLAGDNTRRLAQTARSVPSRGSNQLADMLEARVATQGARIADDAATAYGHNGADFQRGIQTIAQRRGAETGPIYGRLETMTTPADGKLGWLMQRPALQSALKQAAETFENKTGQVVDLSGPLPFRVLDQAKKELDKAIRWGKSPQGAAQGADAVALKSLQAQYLKELDRRFPGYARARAVHADETALLDAADAGRKFLRGDVDEITADFAALSRAEQDAFRLGAAREIRRVVDSAPDGADAANRLIRSKELRDRLRAIAPDEAALDRFVTRLHRESRYAQARNEILKGSQTQPRQQAAEAAADFMETAALGGQAGLLKKVVQRVMARAKGIDEPTADRITTMLGSSDIDGVIEWLASKQVRAPLRGVLGSLTPAERRAVNNVLSAHAALMATG